MEEMYLFHFYTTVWAAPSEFGIYRLCEQRRFRRACASAQSRQNFRCSLIQAVSQEEPSDGKPDPWPLWMAGHAQLKFVMTECSKTQIRLTRPVYIWMCLLWLITKTWVGVEKEYKMLPLNWVRTVSSLQQRFHLANIKTSFSTLHHSRYNWEERRLAVHTSSISSWLLGARTLTCRDNLSKISVKWLQVGQS